MSEKVIIGHLTPGDPFFEIFPDGTVPLLHPFPVMFDGSPAPCYLVDGSALNDLQVIQSSEGLIHRYFDFDGTLEELNAVIRESFPMLCSHFSGVESDDPGLVFFCMDALFSADDNRDLDGYDCEDDE
jgi:hypothetical protein